MYASDAGSREQGAGSREQGAGSREQGAGYRVQGEPEAKSFRPLKPNLAEKLNHYPADHADGRRLVPFVFLSASICVICGQIWAGGW